jgi:hypothetical protein
MDKPELIWPGDRMRGFFRAVLAGEVTLDAATRERLVEALSRPVNRMLVWRNPADEPQPAAAPVEPEPVAATADAEPLAGIAPWPDAAGPAQPAEAPFDPYAFSVVAVFTQGGRDALMDRLAAIGSPRDLRALARAQHLALSDEQASEPDALREAIVTGTEQRIADRRAAAS